MIFGNAILNGVVRKYFSDKVIGKQRYKNRSQGTMSVPCMEQSTQRKEQAQIPFGEYS